MTVPLRIDVPGSRIRDWMSGGSEKAQVSWRTVARKSDNRAGQRLCLRLLKRWFLAVVSVLVLVSVVGFSGVRAQWCHALRAVDGSQFNDGAFNGSVVIGVGFSRQYDSLGRWAHVAAFDTAGNILWQKVFKMDPFGSNPDNIFTATTALPGGDFLVVMGSGNGTAGITTLMRLTATGDTLWTRTYDIFPGEEYFYVAKPLPSGEVLLAGTGMDASIIFMALVWVDPGTGSIVRIRAYRYPAIAGLQAIRDFHYRDGKLFLIGNNESGFEATVFAIDTMGNPLWTRYFSTSAIFLHLLSMAVSPSGNTLYVTGFINGQDLNGNYGLIVIALDTAGTIQWMKQYINPTMPYLDARGQFIRYLPGQNALLVAGSDYSARQMLVKINASDGQLLWASKYDFRGDVLKVFPYQGSYYLLGTGELPFEGTLLRVDTTGVTCCAWDIPPQFNVITPGLTTSDTFSVVQVPAGSATPISAPIMVVADTGLQDLCQQDTTGGGGGGPTALTQSDSRSALCRIVNRDGWLQVVCLDAGVCAVRLYTLTGAVLKEARFAVPVHMYRVALEGLPAGVYILEVEGDGYRWMEKVVWSER